MAATSNPRCSHKSHDARKSHGSVLQNQSYCRSKLYFVGIGIFDHFCSCDLDLDPMTFIYKNELYPPEIYRKCKNEILTSRLSKVNLL